jgi:hypothetical protein
MATATRRPGFSLEDARAEMLKWSSTEKAIARRCSDRALQQELDAAIQSTKEMAAKIRQASELWELEHHLILFGKAGSQQKTSAVYLKTSSAPFASIRHNVQIEMQTSTVN